jgi:hypothetical protein
LPKSWSAIVISVPSGNGRATLGYISRITPDRKG